MLYDTETDLFNRCLEKTSILLEKFKLTRKIIFNTKFPFLLSRNGLQLAQTSFFNNYAAVFRFNKCILLEKQSFLFQTMSNNALNDIGHIFNNNRETKDWETIKLEFNSENKFHFSWKQLIDSILEKEILWMTKVIQ